MKKLWFDPSPKEVFDYLILPYIKIIDGCWIPKQKASKNGYVYVKAIGFSMVGYEKVAVHRLAHAAFKFIPLKSQVVMHTCDVKVCCNPEHLIAGTQAENLSDMDAKGRRRSWYPFGDLNPTRRKDVREKISVAKRERDILKKSVLKQEGLL